VNASPAVATRGSSRSTATRVLTNGRHNAAIPIIAVNRANAWYATLWVVSTPMAPVMTAHEMTSAPAAVKRWLDQ